MQIGVLQWLGAVETHVFFPLYSLKFDLVKQVVLWLRFLLLTLSLSGMNGAVRAVVRMGLYVGAKVYFIHEVSHKFIFRTIVAFSRKITIKYLEDI